MDTPMKSCGAYIDKGNRFVNIIKSICNNDRDYLFYFITI